MIVKETLKAIGLILIGLAIIEAVQFGIYPWLAGIGALLGLPSLGIQSGDWNTLRAIWTAEIPLAFVLKWATGGYKSELVESAREDFDLALKILNERDQYTNFMLVEALPKRGPSKRFYIVNKRNHKLYRATVSEWRLAYHGLFDLVSKPDKEVIAYLSELGCAAGDHYEKLPQFTKASLTER